MQFFRHRQQHDHKERKVQLRLPSRVMSRPKSPKKVPRLTLEPLIARLMSQGNGSRNTARLFWAFFLVRPALLLLMAKRCGSPNHPLVAWLDVALWLFPTTLMLSLMHYGSNLIAKKWTAAGEPRHDRATILFDGLLNGERGLILVIPLQMLRLALTPQGGITTFVNWVSELPFDLVTLISNFILVLCIGCLVMFHWAWFQICAIVREAQP